MSWVIRGRYSVESPGVLLEEHAIDSERGEVFRRVANNRSVILKATSEGQLLKFCPYLTVRLESDDKPEWVGGWVEPDIPRSDLIKPAKGETQSEFEDRCASDPDVLEQVPREGITAFCSAQWRWATRQS